MIIKLLDNTISNSISIIITNISITNIDNFTRTVTIGEQKTLFNTLASQSKITIDTSPSQIIQIKS